MKLSLISLIVISSSVFASQTNSNDNRKERLKQAVYVGGAVAGGIVSWRVLRRLDYKLGQILIDRNEKIARRSRMPLSRFTKVEITDPPIYRLTAPDGSQHHILGTYHNSNISISDFPADSKLFPILEQANILMPERITRFTSVYTYLIKKRLRPRKLFTPQEKLSEQLGEEYWQKLTQMIAEKPDLKPFEQPLDEFMNEFDRLTVEDAYQKLMDYGYQYATPLKYLAMDWQLVRYGHKHGKKVIGLETEKQAFKKLLEAEAEYANHISIDDLKQFIDEGGIDGDADHVLNLIHQYGKGRYERTPMTGDKFLLDQRNIAWVESGKIQKNCVQGNKCLIFVGNAHLSVQRGNTLIELLQKQGYKIENLCKQQMLEFC